MTRRILINRIVTPDGTVLTSRHVHDMVSHTDKVSGEYYFTDGGNQYLRRSVNTVPATDRSVYTDDRFELIRQEFEWGSYGRNHDQPLRQIKLADLEQDHIDAILRTQTHLPEFIQDLFRAELEYRCQHRIDPVRG